VKAVPVNNTIQPDGHFPDSTQETHLQANLSEDYSISLRPATLLIIHHVKDKVNPQKAEFLIYNPLTLDFSLFFLISLDFSFAILICLNNA
jgi:hypothetical protein